MAKEKPNKSQFMPLISLSLGHLLNVRLSKERGYLLALMNDELEVMSDLEQELANLNEEIMRRPVREREAYFESNFASMLSLEDSGCTDIPKIIHKRLGYFQKAFLEDSKYARTSI